MVEIGGQIGVVEDLGLRMTKLRNFVGQVVVIPNRNISVVANYSRGALMATLEVAIANREQINEAGAVLLNVAAEVQRQFHGVVLRDPQLLEPMMLKTGEQFAQLNLGIWPGQQWLIDGQLAPRIREALAREKVAMPAPPADRIAVHYFPPREAAVSDWHQAIQMLQRLREQPRLERFREFMD
jgi:small conductance mechanosensitive channel